MTVTYTADISNAHYSSFVKTVLRWKGSLWKAISMEFCVWLILWAIIMVVYRCALDDEQQIRFERIARMCIQYQDTLPLTFMLGFFVSLVVKRWHDMMKELGWSDNYALITDAYLHGRDERSKMMRRSISRYMTVVQILAYRWVSPPVKKRFPTIESIQKAGLLDEWEMKKLDPMKFWQPVQWCYQILRQARKEGRITCDQAVSDCMEHMGEIRTRLLRLVVFDLIPVPLVYTQVVLVCVRVYFIVMLVGRQFINSSRNPNVVPIDVYFPIFAVIQFVVYVGWMKVAEALMNPWGLDDDDFEANFILDRNMKVSMSILDGGFPFPPLVQDKFWQQDHVPMYTKETASDGLSTAGLIPFNEGPMAFVKMVPVKVMPPQAQGRERSTSITPHIARQLSGLGARDIEQTRRASMPRLDDTTGADNIEDYICTPSPRMDDRLKKMLSMVSEVDEEQLTVESQQSREPPQTQRQHSWDEESEKIMEGKGADITGHYFIHRFQIRGESGFDYKDAIKREFMCGNNQGIDKGVAANWEDRPDIPCRIPRLRKSPSSSSTNL